MTRTPLSTCALFAVAISGTLAAQEEVKIPFSPDVIADCSSVSDGEETLLHSCFPQQAGKFYGRTFVYFSLENTDLNQLIKQSENERSFWKSLKSLFVQNNDTAHFVLRSRATDSSGEKINIATYPLLTIRKRGNKDYHLSRFETLGSLSTRFVGNRLSDVENEIVVVLEREADSRVLDLLSKASRLVGIRVPIGGDGGFTPEQTILVELDEEISKFLSFKSNFRTITGLGFDQGDANAFQTSAVLNSFLPDGVNPRLVLAAYPEQSMFDTAATFNGKAGQEMAPAGGLTASQVLATEINGRTISSRLLTQLKESDYAALKYGAESSVYSEACQKLDFWLDNGGLELTGEDGLRVQWALMSGAPALEKEAYRTIPCVAALEDQWSDLGLGLPPLEPARLPDEFWIIYDKANSEVERANQVISLAVDARNTARSNGEAARRGIEQGYFVGDINAFFQYAGSPIDDDKQAIGVLTELVPDRKGNFYEGNFVVADTTVLYQGLGQYTALKQSEQVPFQSYTGQFEGNYGTGYGRIDYFDGTSYIGETSREAPHGFGSLIRSDGATLFARFIDGKPVGRAVLVDEKGKRSGGTILVNGQFRPIDE